MAQPATGTAFDLTQLLTYYEDFARWLHEEADKADARASQIRAAIDAEAPGAPSSVFGFS